MIRNLSQLAKVIGASAPTIESVSHRVYKDTGCGAHVSVVEPQPTGTRKVRIIAHGVRSICGVIWTKFTVNGRKPTPNVLPEVYGFLEAKKGNNIKCYSTQGNAKIIERGPVKGDEWKVRKLGKLKRQVSFPLEVPARMSRPGVAIGSIVEGVDYGTDEYVLEFPFSEKAWDETLQMVEQQAADIWNDTHGCPKCGPKNPETGGRAINPKCKACRGHGTVL